MIFSNEDGRSKFMLFRNVDKKTTQLNNPRNHHLNFLLLLSRKFVELYLVLFLRLVYFSKVFPSKSWMKQIVKMLDGRNWLTIM
jgi:hypothetical protein